MDMQFKTNTEFNKFKEEITKRLKGIEPNKIEGLDLKRAAVMILIMNKNNEAHVLLTKRTVKVKTHKGHMSFPGGKIDMDDRDALETALRETDEEVGITSLDIELMGYLGEFISIGGFHVCAYVGAINYPCQYKINKGEIEVCVETPLSIFLNKEYDRLDHMKYEGHNLKVYYYTFKEFTIWGLTARILTEFADIILKD